MGAHGPIPKRSEERRRVNKPETPLDTIAVTGSVAIPPANPRWHPVARRIYDSLEHSGQAKFYEPSDWAAAYLLAEALSRDLKPQAMGVSIITGRIVRATVPLKGASFAAYLKAFAALGVTEGDRRRIGIEIDRKPQAPVLASVSVMDKYRIAYGDGGG